MSAGKTKLLSHADDIADSWTRELPDKDLTGFLLIIYIIRMGRMLDDTFDRQCRKKYGISSADMRVLFALRRAGSPYARRATDLYRALLVTSGAMSKQVDRLSKRGLVERTVETGAVVRLTAKGLKDVKSAVNDLTHDSSIAKAINSLNPAQMKAGYAVCQHVLQHLEIINGSHRQR